MDATDRGKKKIENNGNRTTAIFVESLDNSQHTTRFTPERRVYTFQSGHEDLKSGISFNFHKIVMPKFVISVTRDEFAPALQQIFPLS